MPFPFEFFAPVAALVGLAAVLGWVYTTRLRIKHGYPLDGAWGQAVYPKTFEPGKCPTPCRIGRDQGSSRQC
jgi:hypothetical protein